MAGVHSKWHNWTSLKTRSTETSDGLAAIQALLNNLGQEIKKVNEKVYAAQRPSMEESLTKFMAESAKRHEENSNIIKEIKVSTDAAIRNQGALIKTLEIQIRQMSKVMQERGFGSLPSSIETNPRDHIKSISTAKADSFEIRRIGCGPYAAPPSSDYVPGPEEPDQAPLSLEFVPEPVYPEFIPPEDEAFPAKEQQLLATISPTTDSPRYIANSDLEEDEEDPEEDPTDYPADRGDDDDDDDESSDDDKDDDDVEEDEEHPALADSVPPPPVHHTTARISISAQAPIPFLSKDKAERFLAIPTPPPSPLTLLSSPLLQIPSPPLPISPPLPVSPPLPPASPTYPLGFRAAMIRLRAESPSTSHSPPPIILSHTRAPMAKIRADAPSNYTLAPRSETPPLGIPPLLPISLPTPSPPLLLPSTDRRADRPEIRRDLERDVGYGITVTWYEMLVGMPGAPATDDTELGRRMIKFFTMIRQDTDEIEGGLGVHRDA
ncbi:hypothetical protein Tco_0838437 [Tanacetum coccineum]|uniref:Uncharacterized protein n=1 Tax=Tanacetum coccineum TaxID=301880 RepID=A0ABQ5AMT5_9ASTR